MERATGRAADDVIGEVCFDVFPWLKKCRYLMEQAMKGREVRIEERVFSDPTAKVATPYNVTIKPSGQGPTKGIVAIFEIWPRALRRALPGGNHG